MLWLASIPRCEGATIGLKNHAFRPVAANWLAAALPAMLVAPLEHRPANPHLFMDHEDLVEDLPAIAKDGWQCHWRPAWQAAVHRASR
jgi:hypothetical protein